MNFGIEAPDGGLIFPNGRAEYENDGWIWKWSKEKVQWGIENKFLEFVESNKSQGYRPVIIATKLDKINRSQKDKQVKLIRTTLGMKSAK